MSSNLLKQFATVVQEDEKRVIDVNALLQRRREERARQQRVEDSDGFAAGLDAQEISVDEMGEAGGNVLKAQEDIRQMLDQAREDAEAILARAREDAAALNDQDHAQAEEEKAGILAEAKQQGYAEGLRKAQAEEQKLRQSYQEKERQLEEFYQSQLDGLESQLVAAITGIYEQIFRVELSSNRDILTYLISATMKKVDGGREFLIHVSKEDYPYVSMQKKQLLAGAVSAGCSIETVEDLTLAKNECLIETENGIFDCGLGTQLAELKQKLTLLSWSGEE